MNKIFRYVLIIALLSILTLAVCLFTACNDSHHKHTVDENVWESNKNWHYNPYSCGHVGGSNRGEHEFNHEFVCTVCGYSGVSYVLSFDRSHYILRSVDKLPSYLYGRFDVLSEYNGLPVTVIGDGAFKESGIQFVNIPNTVEMIEGGAFYGTDLRAVYLPNSVTSVGHFAFAYCKNLSDVKLSANLRTLGNNVFDGCSLLSSIELPDGLERLGDYAFRNCSSLSSVELPDGLERLGAFTFENCTSIVSAKVTAQVVGKGAFQNCENLRYLTIAEDVKSIDGKAFSGCTKIHTVYWNAINYEDATDSGVLGSATTEISAVFFGESVETIPNGLLSRQKNLTTVLIGAKVKSIGDFAFYDCTSLSKVDFLGEIDSVGRYAFCGCVALKDIDVSKIKGSIGEAAFGECGNLRTVEIAATIRKIERYAFVRCVRMYEFTVPSDSALTEIAACAFLNCSSLVHFTLPAQLATLDPKAFDECCSLVEICNLSTLNIDKGVGLNALYVYGNYGSSRLVNYQDFIFYDDGSATDTPRTLVKYVGEQSQVTLPEYYYKPYVKYKYEVRRNAFRDLHGVTELIIPPSQNYIAVGLHAFSNLPDLTTVVVQGFLDGLGDFAFYKCTALENVDLGHTGYLGACVFSYCDSLERIDIPYSVVRIGDFAFANCSSLKEVNFTNDSWLTEIGGYAFASCPSLESIRIPGYIERIMPHAFANNPQLKNIYLVRAYDWAYSNVKEGPYTSVAATVMSDPATVAQYFTSDFADCYWTRT